VRRCPAAVEAHVFDTESWTTAALLPALRLVLPRTHLCAVVAGRIDARLEGRGRRDAGARTLGWRTIEVRPSEGQGVMAGGDTRGTRNGARGADAAITGRSATR